MDVHPTPLPGKRRPAAKPIKKKESNPKIESSKEANCRPKRTFGVPRSTTNISTEKPPLKPLSAKTCKPWKPSSIGAGENRADGMKFRRIGFKVPSPAVATEEVQTPVPSVPPTTPYLSAEHCSKCRLDRLETSSYWLTQIKLAETVGKHFVSAALFHLALECRAEPFLSLQDELKHYIKRHGVISMDNSWKNLCSEYGLSNDQPGVINLCSFDKNDVVLVEQEDPKYSTQDEQVDYDTHKDGCLDFVYLDNLSLDISDEESVKLADNGFVELSADIGKKEPEAAIQLLSSSEDSRDGARKSSENKDSGRKLYGKSSGRRNFISSDPSSQTKAHRSGGSSERSSNALNIAREASNFSGGESTRRNLAVAKVTRTSQLRSSGKMDEKGTTPISNST